MSAPARSGLMRHFELVGQLQPSYHQAVHAPYPDAIDHASYRALLRSAHDIGGEPDVSIRWEEKEEEEWEANTFATCECLAWRGVWSAEERRRRQNVDFGQT